MPVGQDNVLRGGEGRALRGDEMGAYERLQV